MKKMLLLFTILGVILSGTTTYAATTKAVTQKVSVTKKELVRQIAEQQAIYDKYVALSVSFITQINDGAGTITFQELIVLEGKRDECRVTFLAAADKMLELKKQLFNLENNIK